MAYNKTVWQDLPNTTTPINSTNLNKIETGIGDAHDNIGDLTSLETTDKSDLVSAVNEVKGDIEKYSTSEIKIGTWIDGKPLYRKVIINNSLSYNSIKNVSHNISNVGFIKPKEAYIAKTSNTDIRSINYYNSFSTNFVQVNSNQYTYYINDTAFNKLILVVEYTKTTD